jgi:hypothetical protein
MALFVRGSCAPSNDLSTAFGETSDVRLPKPAACPSHNRDLSSWAADPIAPAAPRR